MAQPKPWLEEVIEAFKDIGGHGHYDDVYERIKQRDIMNFIENPNWTAMVRQTIEKYSSDSKVFNGKKDLFYTVEGIGKGHWGLRDFEPSGNDVDLTDDDSGFPEGKFKLRQHIYRERNQKVIKLSKENFKRNHNGKLYCEVCGFNFYDKYGTIGQDFIEGHHVIPVSEMKDGDETKVEDIVLVCSNCHRMLHRKRPWLTKNKLKELIENNKK